MDSGGQASRSVALSSCSTAPSPRYRRCWPRNRRVIANIERVARLVVTKTVYAAVLAAAVDMSGVPFPFFPRHLTIVSRSCWPCWASPRPRSAHSPDGGESRLTPRAEGPDAGGRPAQPLTAVRDQSGATPARPFGMNYPERLTPGAPVLPPRPVMGWAPTAPRTSPRSTKVGGPSTATGRSAPRQPSRFSRRTNVMTGPIDRGNGERPIDRPITRQCTGRVPSGRRCRRSASHGATVCVSHRASAPQVKAAVTRRLAEQGARAELAPSWTADSAGPVPHPPRRVVGPHRVRPARRAVQDAGEVARGRRSPQPRHRLARPSLGALPGSGPVRTRPPCGPRSFATCSR